MLIFIKGLLIGFAIAAPVGPIGILCIQQSLKNGLKSGFAVGMGAATADACYGLIAAFGLTTITAFLLTNQFWIRVIGGVFLLYLSVKLFISKVAVDQDTKKAAKKPLWHAFITTFFLTLTNPSTILSFIAIFAGLGLGTQHSDYIHAMILPLGIFIGSTCWWLLLSGGTALILHHRINPLSMKIINWISGVIMLIFGLLSLKVLF